MVLMKLMMNVYVYICKFSYIYMYVKNLDEMFFLMYFILKLYLMKIGSCKYLWDYFSCIYVFCNVIGLLSFKRFILVKVFK